MTPYLEPLGSLASASVLGWIALGTVLGLFISAIPGIGPAVAIAVLLPLTFRMSPIDGLIFLTCLYQSAEYAGSITAIAIGTPGAPPSAALVLDGYAMTKRGEPGQAFGYSLWSAVTSSVLSIMIILLVAEPLAALAIKVGPVDLTAIDVLALILVGSLTTGSKNKGLGSVALGVLLSTIGLDPITGSPRFTFGMTALVGGLPLVPLLVGIFAFPEALRLLTRKDTRLRATGSNRRVWLSFRKLLGVWPFALLGSVVGFVLGMVPGVAGTVPPWISYAIAKRVSRHPNEYGTGIAEGIVAPEATNSAVMHSTLIPTFFLGVPGTSTSAVLLGAMTIVGLQPGPQLFAQHRILIFSILEALLLGIVALFLFALVLTNIISRVVTIVPRQSLGIAVIVFGLMGAFVSTGTEFGMVVATISGVCAFFMSESGYSVAAVAIGFILGRQFEDNARTSLAFSHGSFAVFVLTPFSAVVLFVAVSLLLSTTVGGAFRRRQNNGSPGGE